MAEKDAEPPDSLASRAHNYGGRGSVRGKQHNQRGFQRQHSPFFNGQPGTESGRGNSRFHGQSDENVRRSVFERLDGGYNHRQQNGNGRGAIKRIVLSKSEESDQQQQQQNKRTREEQSQHWQRQGGNPRQHYSRQHQRGRPHQGLNFRSNRNNNLNAEYPLKNLGLHDLLMSSNEKLVLILANESNKFEDLIKSKLTLEEFKLVLQMLDKVCQSEYDINKIQILNQACHPEFLRQFNTLLLQGLAGNELSNLLNSMNDFFLTVMKLMPATACDKLKSDVCVLNACIKGLSQQGNVQIDSKVLENLEGIINDLDKIQGTTSKPKLARERNREQEQLNPPPNDFREISIYPTIEDVLSNDRPYLRSNVVQGRYFDVEHYLDVQFRLLREDYVRPLREGIADYLCKGPSTRKCDAPSVRIYKDITFIKYVKEVTGTRLVEGTLLSFKLPGKRSIDWEHSKRFMHGALLCFTNNNFQDLLFATVCERDKKYLSQNQLLVQFCEPYEENIYQGNSYIMLESEVFFEPYYQVLKTLQALDETTFPMRDYIIEVKNTDAPPKYMFNQNPLDAAIALHPNKKYVLGHATQNRGFKVDVIDKSTWPSAEKLGLDPSQHTALHTALTNELAVIQGPPGTGKTFMALKIAETLIINKRSIAERKLTSLGIEYSSSPILVVCLTNHALDQFLVGILKFTKNLIRIGGQSKCQELDHYNLKRIRSFHDEARNELYHELSDSKNDYIKSLEKCQDYLACISSGDGIIPIELLEPMIEEQNLLSIPPDIKRDFYDTHNFLLWLFDGQELVISRQIAYSSDFTQPYRFFRLRFLLKHYENNEYEKIKDARFNGEDENSIFWYESKIQFNVIFTANFIDDLELQVGNLVPPTEEQAAKLLHGVHGNMWKLKIHHRWQLYAFWVQKFDEYCQKKIRELENKILEKNKRIEELRFHDSLEVLRRSDVVGLTTNGAARLHKMLQMLKCKIVIVEEAAEVMESHVVACLNEHCQHLILIGDHKQLRPNIAVYALGKFHNFDVSLFERFARNRGQCVTLQVQHRMAPEMATLIVPTIYPVLYNDPIVLQRPAVDGVPKRLFFVSHTQPEQQDTEMTSRKNEHEALFLIALCEHLIIQGYEESQITILTTYKGQMFYMKKEIRNGNHNTIENVHVTVVDNFQGEENDIILLSLVRSNNEGRIGFLATENRVCVALSRARQALYIVGNMELLSGASDIWKAIRASLLDLDSLGPALPLKCQVHQHQQFAVSLPEDFRKYAPEGGCTEICPVTLNCGHECERICHLMNRDHEQIQCLSKNPCTRMCEANLHWCEKRCNQDCGKCMELVKKRLPCGHEYVLACWTNPATVPCNATVEKEFEPCKHKANVKCSDTKCPHPCENRLPCGHSCNWTCHVENDPDHLKYTCMKLCTKLNKNCKSEHPCEKLCHEECDNCEKMVKRKLACGHQLEMKCTTDPDTIKCKKKCKKTLSCGHWCRRGCFEPCKPCQEVLTKQIEDCKHEIKFACGVEPQREHCKQKCERLLECGHPCTRNCAEPCQNKECAAEVGIVTASCGHEIQLLCWEKTKGLSEPSESSRCRQPCKEKLICGHTCSGDCFSCKQGRYHILCKQVCQRKFACGHRCSGLCSNPCQLCRKDCNNHCAHQNCYQKCGVQCNPCKKMCTWSCEHYNCTRHCSLSCNRPPCDEPCKKKLKCDHLCAGLCGETCPKLCWECDKQQLISEAMVQGEVSSTENPRFIVLPDCRHTVEVLGLEQWLAWQASNMQVRSCPRCEMPIRTLARYKNQVQQANKDLSSIQQKIFQHQDILQKCSELKFLIQQLQKQKLVGTGVFHDLSNFLKRASLLLNKPAGRHFNLMFANTVEILDLQMSSITNICSALECCQHADSTHILELQPVVTFIMDIVQEKNGQFGMQVAHDVSREILRLYHMAKGLQRLTQSSKSAEKNIQQFMKHMHQPKCYSKEMELATTNILKQWGIYCIPKLEIKIKVPMQPLNELWKKCPDQHENFNAYIPLTELKSCNVCNVELLKPKCPKFKVANQPTPVDKKEKKPANLPKNAHGNSQNGNLPNFGSKLDKNPHNFNHQLYNPPHLGNRVINRPQTSGKQSERAEKLVGNQNSNNGQSFQGNNKLKKRKKRGKKK